MLAVRVSAEEVRVMAFGEQLRDENPLAYYTIHVWPTDELVDESWGWPESWHAAYEEFAWMLGLAVATQVLEGVCAAGSRNLHVDRMCPICNFASWHNHPHHHLRFCRSACARPQWRHNPATDRNRRPGAWFARSE
jgi:hypothetical protein